MSAWGSFSGFQLPTATAPSGFTRGAILDSYNANHAASRNANQSLFERTVAGFGSVLSQQEAALAAAQANLRGTNRANVRSINRRFTAESGDIAQDLISRGLGNSTIQGSMQTGLARAHADALSGSRAAFGEKLYKAAADAATANSGLATQQLSTLLSQTQIGYPDFGAYANMAMMAGPSAGGFGSFAGGAPGVMVGDMSRPIGGAGPQGAAFYDQGVPDMSGFSFAGAPGITGGGFAGPNTAALGFGGGRVVSGYGHDMDGSYNPSFASSDQYGGSGYSSGYDPAPEAGGYYYGGASREATGYGGKSTTTY